MQMFKIHTLIVLLGLLSPALAAGETQQERLMKALTASGIYATFDSISAVIIDETNDLRKQCSDSMADRQALMEKIGSGYKPAVLRHLVHNAVEARVSADVLERVTDWYASSDGVRVSEAERAVSELDEQATITLEQTLSESPAWTADRRKLVQQIVVATQADAFVSAVHLSIAAATTATKACRTTELTERLTNTAIRNVTKDLSLVRFFVLLELVLPTGVAYRELDDTTLHAYLDFATSDTGRIWHQALIEAVIETLTQPIPELIRSRSDKSQTDASGDAVTDNLQAESH